MDSDLLPEKLAYTRAFMPMSYQEAYQRLDKLRKQLLPHSREVMVGHRFEVFAAVERMLHIIYVASKRGLAPLKEEEGKLLGSGSELECFLAIGIKTEALAACSSMSDMFCVYDSSGRSTWKDFIRYIYIRGVLMMTVGVSALMAKMVLFSLLPEEERRLFEKYQQHGDGSRLKDRFNL